MVHIIPPFSGLHKVKKGLAMVSRRSNETELIEKWHEALTKADYYAEEYTLFRDPTHARQRIPVKHLLDPKRSELEEFQRSGVNIEQRLHRQLSIPTRHTLSRFVGLELSWVI